MQSNESFWKVIQSLCLNDFFEVIFIAGLLLDVFNHLNCFICIKLKVISNKTTSYYVNFNLKCHYRLLMLEKLT